MKMLKKLATLFKNCEIDISKENAIELLICYSIENALEQVAGYGNIKTFVTLSINKFCSRPDEKYIQSIHFTSELLKFLLKEKIIQLYYNTDNNSERFCDFDKERCLIKLNSIIKYSLQDDKFDDENNRVRLYQDEGDILCPLEGNFKFLILLDDEKIGVIEGSGQDEYLCKGEVYIDLIFIEEKYRRNGFGQLAIKRFIDVADSYHTSYIRGFCDKWIMSFFRKCGAQFTLRNKRLINNKTIEFYIESEHSEVFEFFNN